MRGKVHTMRSPASAEHMAVARRCCQRLSLRRWFELPPPAAAVQPPAVLLHTAPTVLAHARARARARAHAHACERARVRACACACVRVRAEACALVWAARKSSHSAAGCAVAEAVVRANGVVPRACRTQGASTRGLLHFCGHPHAVPAWKARACGAPVPEALAVGVLLADAPMELRSHKNPRPVLPRRKPHAVSTV